MYHFPSFCAKMSICIQNFFTSLRSAFLLVHQGKAHLQMHHNEQSITYTCYWAPFKVLTSTYHNVKGQGP